MTRRPVPAGHSLAEAIVALGLLGVAALVITGASLAASRILASAEAEEGAVAVALVLMDSLLAAQERNDGEAARGLYHAQWTFVAEGGTLILVLDYHDRSEPRQRVYATRWSPPPMPMDDGT